MATINVSEPWNHPNAVQLDSQTLSSWLDHSISSPEARFLLDVATTSVFSAEARELSLLYAASYFAAAGNETTTGSIQRITGTDDGAQAYRIRGGTQLLATKLVEKLGSNYITLNAPVNRIEKKDNTYAVLSGALQVNAKQVVIAMSPPLAARISYSPLLPASRDQLSQRMFMGSEGKAIAIYTTPFWRANGLNGQALSSEGVVRTTFDNSPADASYGSVMGFIEADQMRALDGASDQKIIEAVTHDYVNFFGQEAANATEWIIQRWDNEEYSRGGPVALAGPGVLTDYGTSLRARFEGIHFAGTEASPYWTGYMDGAIRSGQRAATDVLVQLASRSTSH